MPDEYKEFREGFFGHDPLEEKAPKEDPGVLERIWKGYTQFLRNNVTEPVREAFQPNPDAWSGMADIIQDREHSRQSQSGAQEFERFWTGLAPEEIQRIEEFERRDPAWGQAVERALAKGDYAGAQANVEAVLGR